MHNKEQARLVGPLVNNPQVWKGLEEYLNLQKELLHRGLVTAQSESELLRLQGKAVLLETLLNLKSSYEAIQKNKE